MKRVPPSRRRPGLGPARSAVLAVVAALASAACSEPRAPRGVLLISIDSLRHDHVGAYGYRSATRPDVQVTPAIDRLLADQGALFEHAVSTTSWTLPAHLSLLTGLPNEVHGVRDLPDRLPPDRRLLTEVFRDRGWRTFGIWSGPNLHPWFGFDRGFERYVDCSTSAVVEPDRLFGLSSEGRWNDVRSVHESSHRGITGPKVLAAFGDFAASLGDERFFAFVHLWDVHYDYNAPAEFDVFYPGYDGPIDGQDFHALATSRARLTQADLWRLLSLYDAEIRYVDHQIETMLAMLEERGRLADTLVIVTSDHGEEFLEHGALGHKASLYEEVLRIPLLVRLPGRIPAGARHGGLVSLLDVAPTIADFCGLPFPANHGRSLRSVLEGRGTPGVRPVPIELSVRPVDLEMRGLHAGDHKVLHTVTSGTVTLFDLVADPEERSGKSPPRLRLDDPRVARAFDTWRALDAEAATLRPVDAAELPRGLAEDLTRAGYLGDVPEGE